MLLRISKKMSKRVNKSKGEQEAGNGIKVPGRELVGLMESFNSSSRPAAALAAASTHNCWAYRNLTPSKRCTITTLYLPCKDNGGIFA